MSKLLTEAEDLISNDMDNLNVKPIEPTSDDAELHSNRQEIEDDLPVEDMEVAQGEKEVTQENLEADVVHFLKKTGANSEKKAVLISKISRDMKGAPLATDLKRSLNSMKNVKVVDGSVYYMENVEIRECFSNVKDLLIMVSESEGVDFNAMVEEVDREVFSCYNSYTSNVKLENSILNAIGRDVLERVKYSRRSLSSFNESTQVVVEKVSKMFNKGTSNIISILEGLKLTQFSVKLHPNTTLEQRDLMELSSIPTLKYVTIDQSQQVVRIVL